MATFRAVAKGRVGRVLARPTFSILDGRGVAKSGCGYACAGSVCWLGLGMASKSDSLVNFPTKPHQPRTLAFPKRTFGTTKTVERSFQKNWFDKWPFLHYDEPKDAVFCHTCTMAFKLQRIKASMRADPAFVSSNIN